MNAKSKKLPALTDKQKFALDYIAKKRVIAKQVHCPFAHPPGVVWKYFAIDSDITNQVKSLRNRRLIFGYGDNLKLRNAKQGLV